MAIDGVHVGGKGKGKGNATFGDPSEADALADGAPNPGRHGQGVTPIEGTSAANVAGPAHSGRQCNSMQGYGNCGGEIVDDKCERCGCLYGEKLRLATVGVDLDDGQHRAHVREAQRQAISREVTSTVFGRESVDPEAWDFNPKSPKIKALQAEIDAECLRRYKAAGLLPRVAA
jgi:hypothetical protein